MQSGWGRYRCIPEKDIFEIEYWSLEQAKLGKAVEKPLLPVMSLQLPAAAPESAGRPLPHLPVPVPKWL